MENTRRTGLLKYKTILRQEGGKEKTQQTREVEQKKDNTANTIRLSDIPQNNRTRAHTEPGGWAKVSRRDKTTQELKSSCHKRPNGQQFQDPNRKLETGAPQKPPQGPQGVETRDLQDPRRRPPVKELRTHWGPGRKPP